jgi:hypothetical protein
MEEERRRVRIWSQNLSREDDVDRKPMWRHGRASVTFPNRGRRNYAGTGRQDLDFGTEWRVFVKHGFGLGWKFKWGTNGSETTPDVSFHFGSLGDLWLHVGGLIPRSWLERHKTNHQGERVVDYDSRVFSLNVDLKEIRWQCWAIEGSWSRDQPWWYEKAFNYSRIAFGRTKTDERVVDSGACLVPMPEKNYPASFEIVEYVNRYQRPLGRLRDRALGARRHWSTTITPGEPIPVPGKGENSWDCGDDAFHSSSSGGRNIDKAIAGLVESALSTRRRHGGQHMSVLVA